MVAGALNAEQRRALALGPGPLLVAAGPGSGKTLVVVERLAQALEQGVAPERVVAITFTVKAAGELKVRLAQRLEGGVAAVRRFAYIGTFHGFCASLLGRHRQLAGLGERVEVLEEGRAGLLRRRALARALVELGEREVAVLARYTPSQLAELLLDDLYQPQRSAGNPVPTLPAVEAGGDLGELCTALRAALAGLCCHYEQLKRRRAALDFDDLELQALELLENHRDRVADSLELELVVVDEFQDVNPRQWRLLQALGEQRLFAVGDERQAIYGFRHSDVEIMRRRRAELEGAGRALTLAANHRSHPQLIEAFNLAFGEIEGFGKLQAARSEADGKEPRLELVLVGAEVAAGPALEPPLGLANPGRQAEALAVARRVAALVEGGFEPQEVALLLRSRTALGCYLQALEALGLKAAVGGSFWEDPAVRALLFHLQAALNPADRGALIGALASPLGGLAAAQAPALWAWLARSKQDSLQRPPAALERYLELLEGTRKELASGGLAAALEAVVGRWSAAAERAAVRELLEQARRFERREGVRPRAFLRYAALARKGAEREAPAVEVPGAVRVLTIHAAKGLEFAVVVLAELGSAVRPRAPLALVDGGRMGLLREREGRLVEELDYPELWQARRRQEEAEELRLLYVAMTRARERLVLSGRLPKSGTGSKPTSLELLLERFGYQPPADLAEPQLELELDGSLPLRVTLCGAVVPPPAGRPALPEPIAPAAGGRWQRRAAALAELLGSREALSYSSIAKLERCSLRFVVEDLVGADPLPELPRAGGLEGRAFGSLLHELLAAAPLAGRPTAEQVIAKAYGRYGVKPTDGQLAELLELLEVALDGELVRELAGLALAREVPFSVAIPGLPLPIGGYFDLYGHDRRGAAVVLDYKTDRLGAGVTPQQRAADRYGLQQRLYALAALQEGAKQVELIHWFLRDPLLPVRARFEAADRPRLEGDLRKLVSGLLARPPEPAAKPHRLLCAGCPARGGPCPWPVPLTRRPPPR